METIVGIAFTLGGSFFLSRSNLDWL